MSVICNAINDLVSLPLTAKRRGYITRTEPLKRLSCLYIIHGENTGGPTRALVGHGMIIDVHHGGWNMLKRGESGSRGGEGGGGG